MPDAAGASSISWQPVELTGWGRTSRVRSMACRPDAADRAQAALAQRGAPVLAHGAGRSYGDAALNSDGRTILTAGMNRILEFDAANGTVVCEAGVTFRDLLLALLPQGWLFPVSPGTAFTTIGGAVANDVHGKNHEQIGGFGQHVLWLELALPSGERRRVSSEHDPGLFAATIGGVGLTGLILKVSFRLQRVPSAGIEMEERRITDLDAFMAAFEACRSKATFSVGWIDAMARGTRLGRGILETAEFAPQYAGGSLLRRARRVPCDLPGSVLNPLSIRLFNELYYRRIPSGGRQRIVPVERFLYPLDAIGDWNRIYGRRGFYQFQCVIPDRQAPAGVRALLQTIAAAGQGSFLAVLKTLGGEGAGHLSFPLRGYTLALDFPRRAETPALFRKLEEICLAHEGRVYLAKDALLSAQGFRAMYPRHGTWCEVLDRVDPEGRMSSDMARRLRLRET